MYNQLFQNITESISFGEKYLPIYFNKMAYGL